MKLTELSVSPRLTKMESAIHSTTIRHQASPPVEDTVDLSGEALRIIQDSRTEPDRTAVQREGTTP